MGARTMDCKGCSTEVKAVALPGNNTVTRNKGSGGADISISRLLLNMDNLCIAGNPSCSNRLHDDTMVCEILSRLPVKSLMRFKCVCKSWLHLIEQDSYFKNLHLTQSKARPSLFYMISMSTKDQQESEFRHKGHDQFFLTADLSLKGIGRADFHTTTKKNMFCCDRILGPINGLVCLVDRKKYAVQIYNISTREASPWFHSNLLLDEKEKHPSIDTQGYHGTTYKFGYDPSTKEYKVLCLWHISLRRGFSLEGDSADDYDEDIEVCEILTLGNSTWRRIDAIPPCSLNDFYESVYANGSIYWCTSMFTRPQQWLGFPICIAAFDVGTEKFRMIEVPKFIRDQPLDPDPYYHPQISLLEVDGCLGIVRRITDYVCKLWIFNDDHRCSDTEKDNKSWSEETISLPFPWNRTRRLYFDEVVGTYQIILKDYQITNGHINRISLHSYHRKEKSFTDIKTNGASLLIPDACFSNMLTIFVESLLPVQQKRVFNGTLG